MMLSVNTKNNIMTRTVLLLMTLVFVSCNQAQEQISPTATLISDVNIIDVRTGNILQERQIVIDSGKIKKISEQLPNADDFTNVIDGKGKYAVPGLAEMHAHIPSPNTTKERIEETLFLYLSNGVTTIRGMLGHPSHLAMRKKALSGALLSPRIFTSSPSLNGNSVPTPEVAREKVTAYKDDGYDFLKIHPGIPLDAFDELVKTANEVGITFSGHVPVAVGIRHALESKYASIDHVDGFLEGLVPEEENVNPAENGFFGFAFTNLAKTDNIPDLVQLAKENEVWIVPTQSLFERWFAPISSDELLSQPEMKYMPASTLQAWKNRKEQTTGTESGFDKVQYETFDAIRLQLIKSLQENGHGLLLGSDAPQLFNVPGFSIHHEIAGMVRAKLSTIEILRSGTINPAIFFGMDDQFGEIKENMDADIVLVNANPLEDLSALKSINGVMVRGTWLSKQAIDKKLEEIAVNAANN